MMATVRFAARYHAHDYAVVSDNQHVDYQDFYALAQRLSHLLYHKYHLKSGQQCGIVLPQPSCFSFASACSFTIGRPCKILIPTCQANSWRS